MSKYDEQNSHHSRQSEAIIREGSKTVVRDVGDEESDRQVSDHGRCNESHGEEESLESSHALGEHGAQLQKPGAADDRHAHQERKSGRFLTSQAQKKPERDGSTRARNPRYECHGLGEPYTNCLPKPQFECPPVLPTHYFGHYEEYTDEHKVEDDHPRQPGMDLDKSLEEKTDESRWDSGGENEIR